jgi:hypothetical protein
MKKYLGLYDIGLYDIGLYDIGLYDRFLMPLSISYPKTN